jgi:chromosome segregation ATPase
VSQENKAMSVQLNDLRLQVEKLEFDNKESVITVDILKEQNADSRNELEEFKRIIADLKSSQKDPSAEDKEKKKQEKMALMMAQFDMARIKLLLVHSWPTDNTPNISSLVARVFFREGRTNASNYC